MDMVNNIITRGKKSLSFVKNSRPNRKTYCFIGMRTLRGEGKKHDKFT